MATTEEMAFAKLMLDNLLAADEIARKVGRMIMREDVDGKLAEECLSLIDRAPTKCDALLKRVDAERGPSIRTRSSKTWVSTSLSGLRKALDECHGGYDAGGREGQSRFIRASLHLEAVRSGEHTSGDRLHGDRTGGHGRIVTGLMGPPSGREARSREVPCFVDSST